MMTIQDVKRMLKMLNANYADFYKGTNEADVLTMWAVQFKNDDPVLVEIGVQSCINTFSFRPTIADIRKRMPKRQKQMTEIEAFQAIKSAMRMATDRQSRVLAFNGLPPILRKVVGNQEQLRDWQNVSDESFETVIASMIMRSFRELSEQDEVYNTLPKHLQKESGLELEAPEAEALPEPKRQKTVDEILEEAEKATEAYRTPMSPEKQEKYASRVTDFMKPMSEKEIEAYKKREEERINRRLGE